MPLGVNIYIHTHNVFWPSISSTSIFLFFCSHHTMYMIRLWIYIFLKIVCKLSEAHINCVYIVVYWDPRPLRVNHEMSWTNIMYTLQCARLLRHLKHHSWLATLQKSIIFINSANYIKLSSKQFKLCNCMKFGSFAYRFITRGT